MDVRGGGLTQLILTEAAWRVDVPHGAHVQPPVVLRAFDSPGRKQRGESSSQSRRKGHCSGPRGAALPSSAGHNCTARETLSAPQQGLGK